MARALSALESVTLWPQRQRLLQGAGDAAADPAGGDGGTAV
jgi:hypothetical protein